MISLLLIAAVIFYFYFYVKKKLSLWEEKGIKYVKPMFLLGNASIFRRKPQVEHIKELYSAYPEERYHGIYQFLQPVLVLKDPDLIKQVTVKEFDHFMDHRRFADPDLDPYWGKNLFLSEGDRWKDLRSTLSPSFTSSKMRMMYTLIDECAQQFAQYFKNENKNIIELEMKDALTRYSNDVIASAAFGLKCDSLKNPTNSFYLMGKEATDFSSIKFIIYAICPTINKLLKLKLVPPHVAKYFSEIIEDTIKTREEKKIVRPDMIQLLMEAQKGRQHKDQELDSKIDEGFSSVTESDLTKNKQQKGEITLEDITAQAFIFFLAGFETVSTLITFAFYELAINPTIQDRLRDELLEIQGNVTYENLLKLKYLDMVVSEALRKWPAAIFTDRKVTKAFTIQPERSWEKPLHLEKGLTCWLPIHAIHNDPKFWPEPEKFDPERFNDENKHVINPSVYLPFGAGPRNCIGSRFGLLETKLILFHVLTNFEIVPIEKTKIPMVLDKVKFNLTAEGGMWLGLKKI